MFRKLCGSRLRREGMEGKETTNVLVATAILRPFDDGVYVSSARQACCLELVPSLDIYFPRAFHDATRAFPLSQSRNRLSHSLVGPLFSSSRMTRCFPCKKRQLSFSPSAPLSRSARVGTDSHRTPGQSDSPTWRPVVAESFEQ